VLAAGAVMNAGTEAEKQALLPGIAAGETTATFAWVEDNGRWEAEGTALTATAESGEIVLNGHKSFVVDGHTADLIVVLARAPQGLSLFTVDGNAPGLTRRAQKSRPGPPHRSPRPPRAGLRLVHRRLRHARSQRGKGAARRTGVNRQLACAEIRHECPLLAGPTVHGAWARNGS
jgi:hypothetical protein